MFPFLTTSNYAVEQAVIRSSSMNSDTLPSELVPPTAVPPTSVDKERLEKATRRDATLHHRHRHIRNPLHGWHKRDQGPNKVTDEEGEPAGTAASGVATPERRSGSGRPSEVETPRERPQDELVIPGSSQHPDFDAEDRRVRSVAASNLLDKDSAGGPHAQAAREVQLDIMGVPRVQTKIKEQ
ncbi:hypothetical protein DFP72DRAFT_1132135 [Ephemerocybe angulata]|uniref:Uncharacterized protein n=1 Tax=Ephemerocybe angulata TaxID=980116 RepID=A0A8H6HTY2_9AGAR|nr:hypothetical protein DFP72DRAFT_1132135 [Tulosesus angulatus]